MSSIFKDDKRWIIQSLLDVDFYKFTMLAYIFKFHRGVNVTFRLKNRTSRVRLADMIDINELREQLDHARTLQLTNSESYYLRGMDLYHRHMFSDEFVGFLRTLRLPDYRLSVENGQFVLDFSGPWELASLWETIALSIINEMFCNALLKNHSRFQKQAIYADGIRRLRDKIETLKAHPRILIVEFGTRRRFGRVWQGDVTRALAEELPQQFRGSSNTLLAMQNGYVPMGTNAHELQMVTAVLAGCGGRDDNLRVSHNLVLRQWWEMYGAGLSIALTDTFGSDFFFRDFTQLQAVKWKGLRHDSGDPFEFGERAIVFYRDLGIDPQSKMIIFSDGLDLPTILKLDQQFGDRIMCSYGWGTNLTNDLGLPTLSLVVKAAEANGQPTVKLSDNLAKAMGPSDEIERYARVFGHKGSAFVECKV